ncbi:MAG TPA: sugar phosphate isomerase/epimerase family protein [Dehalococcoidia bacterium]|nr:sugar phosphate isomerase/epimerase family protein [Dehalococcoidia bacterium]
MKPLALSTMYAQQDRFTDGADFARYAAEAGYEAIEISHSTPESKFSQIIEAAVLPIISVHQPAPAALHSDGRANGKLNLASSDPDEREAAVHFARQSIEWAARVGATRVVVHLGQVTEQDGQFEEELQMRRMFDAGQADTDGYSALRNEAILRRRIACEPHLDAARTSLLQLVETARPRGVTVGLENRYHYHEIPQPGEYEYLLEGLDNSEAGYWHDVGHAEVLHRLGFIDRLAWLTPLGDRCVGAHLHDVKGIGDHRSPGDGDVNWDYIVKGVRHLDWFTLEINQYQSDERVFGAREFLAKLALG